MARCISDCPFSRSSHSRKLHTPTVTRAFSHKRLSPPCRPHTAPRNSWTGPPSNQFPPNSPNGAAELSPTVRPRACSTSTRGHFLTRPLRRSPRVTVSTTSTFSTSAPRRWHPAPLHLSDRATRLFTLNDGRLTRLARLARLAQLDHSGATDADSTSHLCRLA